MGQARVKIFMWQVVSHGCACYQRAAEQRPVTVGSTSDRVRDNGFAPRGIYIYIYTLVVFNVSADGFESVKL
jgi:hypothetical protein